jgi:mono/diheme cytochrome c family protein
MKRFLKALQMLVAGVATFVLVCAAAVYGFSEARYRKQYIVTPRTVAARPDSATVARGAHLVNSFGGCVECHGANLGGKMVIDDPAIGRVYGANLTRGKGGIGSALTSLDIVRAMTHGVGRDGRPLKVMPSTDYVHLTDEDLAAIVAYVQAAPPVDGAQPAVTVGPMGRALFVAGKLPILHAERIDHATAKAMAVQAGPTPEYGRYVASVGCKGCHGETLAGGPIEGGAPDWPQAANLTPAGRIKAWTEAEFTQVLRTGKRPDGSTVNPVMPIRLTKNLTDEEVHALWLYLRTLPATPTGGIQTASR